jgi:hypothetical protein
MPFVIKLRLNLKSKYCLQIGTSWPFTG